MTLTLILLLAIIATTILVVNKKSKSQKEQVLKIEDVVLPEVDLSSIQEEKHVVVIDLPQEVTQLAEQQKKKRKYYKKKHPKKMDANKK